MGKQFVSRVRAPGVRRHSCRPSDDLRSSLFATTQTQTLTDRKTERKKETEMYASRVEGGNNHCDDEEHVSRLSFKRKNKEGRECLSLSRHTRATGGSGWGWGTSEH